MRKTKGLLMVPYRSITEEDLLGLKRFPSTDSTNQETYSELWLTADGQIVKLFSNNKVRDCHIQDIQNDISTILALSKTDQKLGNRFAVPQMILLSNSEVIGYSMQRINGVPLSKARSLKPEQFRSVIAQLLKDITFVNNERGFSFADLHEDNIMIGIDSNVYHVDIDGWYIGNGKSRRSRYIALHRNRLQAISKYKVESSGKLIPDINSDLFCLINIVLNYLLQSNMWFAQLIEEEQERYLEYLHGVCNETQFVKMYRNMLSNTENYFDLEIINKIPDDIDVYSFSSFLSYSSKFRTGEDANLFLSNNENRLNTLFPDRKK